MEDTYSQCQFNPATTPLRGIYFSEHKIFKNPGIFFNLNSVDPG